MAISFQLNLTPNQIQFLQGLDLYADGLIETNEITARRSYGGIDLFITYARKLIRDGLVEHVVPKAHQRYKGGLGGPEIIQAYRITAKGRQVLSIIEQDVEAFLQRQKAYREMKSSTRRKTA